MKGYRTYIAAGIMIIAEGLKAVFPEYTHIVNAIEGVAAGAGLGFLRAGVKRDTTI